MIVLPPLMTDEEIAGAAALAKGRGVVGACRAIEAEVRRRIEAAQPKLDVPVVTEALQALRETQEACDVSQCRYCGRWGPGYSENHRPPVKCHHVFDLTSWQSLWPR